MLYLRTLALLIPIIAALTSASAYADDFHVRIERKHTDTKCTSGYMAVDGKVIAYTLELPWQNNQPYISSIPPGTYSGHLRYDKNDKWRIQLDGVPGRDGVQIHIGNYTSQIEGCILVGKDISGDLCTLVDSGTAYRQLKEAFYGTPEPISTPNKQIRVEIVY